MINAQIRYRKIDGRILEANFGPVSKPPGQGEAILEWPHIPDPELYKIVDGKPIRRTDDEIREEREHARKCAIERQNALDAIIRREVEAHPTKYPTLAAELGVSTKT